MIEIVCPHCGYNKSVPREKIPADAKKIRCPKCRESFALETPPPQEADPFGFDFDAPIPLATENASDSLSFDDPPIAMADQSAASSLSFDDGPIGLAIDDSPISLAADGLSSVAPAVEPEGVYPEAGGEDEQFCLFCGEQLPRGAEVCLACGKLLSSPSGKGVNKTALVLITFFLGGIGGHRFYQKKYLLGSLYMLFCLTGIPGLVAFVEFIIYLTRSEADLQQRYPETSTAGVVVAAVGFFVMIAIIGILTAIAIPQFVAYRNKGFSAAARGDLLACQDQVLAYYTLNQVYPTVPEQLQCTTSNEIALYYLSFGEEEYQLVSFHRQGFQAFMVSNSDIAATETSRFQIEQEISSQYGSDMLQPAFHFIEE